MRLKSNKQWIPNTFKMVVTHVTPFHTQDFHNGCHTSHEVTPFNTQDRSFVYKTHVTQCLPNTFIGNTGCHTSHSISNTRPLMRVWLISNNVSQTLFHNGCHPRHSISHAGLVILLNLWPYGQAQLTSRGINNVWPISRNWLGGSSPKRPVIRV